MSPPQPWRRRGGHPAAIPLLAWAIALATAVAILAGGEARALPRLETGFSDNKVFMPSGPDGAATRETWLARAAGVAAGLVRINASWRAIAGAGGPPDDARDPDDPAYDFSRLDAAVRAASDRGLRVLLTIYRAPDWAERGSRPPGVSPGAWQPRPVRLGQFAEAVARRYSGAAGQPRVRHYQAWNEPNLRTYLAPQRRGGRLRGAIHYRRMLREFHLGIHAGGPGNVVVSAGTAPYGDPRGPNRVRPLAFWRRVLCLRGPRRLRPTRCPVRTRLDVLAHHPITTSGGPARAALHHDDVAIADFHRLRRVLRAAERHRRVQPRGGGPRPLWATEVWWRTDPPNNFLGVPPRRQARWIELGMLRLWRQGARAFVNHLIVDGRFNPDNPFNAASTGIYFHRSVRGGGAKPARRAFRFPFVTRRRGPIRALAWGRAPAGGLVRIEVRRRRGWRTAARRRVDAGEVFQRPFRLPRRRAPWRVRAELAGERSLVWTQR